MASIYCECPDEEVTIFPHNSMWGGGDAYCSACGRDWSVSREDVKRFEDRILTPDLRTLEDMEIEDQSSATAGS